VLENKKMDNSNNGLRILLGVLLVILIIGVLALVYLLFNFNRTGGPGTQTLVVPTVILQTPPADLFPTNAPTKDASKLIISEVRNGGDNSITSVSLMIPPSLIGLTAEVNGIPVQIDPIDAGTIRLDIPAGLNAERLEIQFKAGTETRSSCVLNRSDIQRTEGDCIW
jgi:hypothetical protein